MPAIGTDRSAAASINALVGGKLRQRGTVERAERQFAGEDRTLFGTSYPSKPLAPMIAAYSEWDWLPGVREKVLHQNARRLMRIA